MTVETRHPETIEQAIEQAIERGCLVVAAEYGEDWYEQIRLDSLRLSSGRSCVLGQLENRRVKALPYDDRVGWDEYDAYEIAAYRLGLLHDGDNSDTMHGFNMGYLPYDGLDEDGEQRRFNATYHTLQDAWWRKISALRASGAMEV